MAGESYGQMVVRVRNEKGWTQDDLARESGVPRRTLQNYEADAVDRPSRKNVLAINRALDIEGDLQVERSGRPRNVELFLDMMGTHLMNLDEVARIDLMADLTKRIYRGEL